MPTANSSSYALLKSHLRSVATLGSVEALLHWDQETYMPPGGAEARAEQCAALAGIVHERGTDPRLGDLISACESDRGLMADGAMAANIAHVRRDYERARSLPKELVEEIARTGSQSQEVWREARAASDFPRFAPWLDRMMDLARRKADCYGVLPWVALVGGGERYDALLDEYEPGARAREIEAVFTPLRARLSEFVALATSRGRVPDTSCLTTRVEAARQHRFGEVVLRAMGFDLGAGRLDTTTHPFCSGIAPGDTRLTTRYRDEKFTDALYGTMHEAGHGLYEQGLPKREFFGEPLGSAVSLGIHESQSRLWENFVGRSLAFWRWALPIAKDVMGLPSNLAPEDLYRATNTASPSFIRVEADEATYNLHIMLRFDLERALISGSLRAKDVPGAWNAAMRSYLGLDVPDDRRGCLQDVHWSFGLCGYFPTYCLGNLYAAQVWEAFRSTHAGVDGEIERGEFGSIKRWLNETIHAHGRRFTASELCVRATGKPLSHEPLLRHLRGKLGPLLGI